MTPSSSTPTPWEFKDGPTASVVGANGETVCDDEAYYPMAVSVDDMKLIVLAVNSHARAEALARRVVKYFGDGDIDADLDCDIEVRQMARDFLALTSNGEKP